ncbi:wax ester/triacylglycerol synthase family O-acyltransferase [Spongiactinospora rosea]|uniref:Diacylglycerol O-acyltransferase n=1 Tax=Spongiactinospora rosea TaxID=2248750 RepID=A0A366LJE5_9ACTN|nr:wax ester/triacylglycerol synthase family O-acyltransferase [Spongiactinospora rosea]RBQ14006.1 wax ester/triacylglycerol synthase family O-acyltransferase [Spongiactinospora rosea]
MRQLTALDAQFLHAESPTTTAHVAGVAIVDPGDAAAGRITKGTLVALLRRRAHLAPALRLRLAGVPFGLDLPYWAEDPGFDPADHVYETTLPAPELLTDVVARLHERRLSRHRPLWEMHLIHGLEHGRVAIYTKVHHCAIDGVSGAETLAALLDLAPGGPEPACAPPPADPVTAPGTLGMLAGAAVNSMTHPLRALGSLRRTAADLDAVPIAATLPGARWVARAARLLGGEAGRAPALPSLEVPRTPLTGPVSGQRRFAYGSLPLADIRRVGRAFGMSVNDVVMAMCAAALRAWLAERDVLPDRPLIAAVPVAARARTDGRGPGAVGNRISAMAAPIATHLADPLERLLSTREAMRAAKRRFASSPATWLSDLSALLPPPVTALATASVFRLAGLACPPVNLIVSNVPGPRVPLYLCGGKVVAYYPMSVVTDLSGGLSVTCFSYDGSLDFGLLACPRHVDDVWRLLGHLRAALDELSALAGPAPEPAAETAKETVPA